MYIGLDLGTSGTKAVVFNEEGQILASSYKEYNMIFPQEGYIELNPCDVWQAVQSVLKEVTYELKGTGTIKALSISSFGEAFVAVSKEGEVLYNTILATDIRGEKEISSLLEKISQEEIVKITGLPINSTYSVAKMLWLKNHRYDIYQKVWKFLLYQDFIFYRLCGETVSDYSLASRTMLLDVNKRVWSQEILSAAGIESDLLPKVDCAGTIVGTISRHMADELGLPESLILVLGGHDQPCCALGAGVTSPGKAADSIGTSECITLLLERRLDEAATGKYNFPSEPFLIDGSYNTMAYLHTAGALLKWFVNNLADSEELKKIKNLYNYFDTISPEGPSNLFVLPYFAGSGTPYMDSSAKGVIAGLTLGTKKEDIYLAILESIAFEMENNIRCIEESDIEITNFYAVGGGSKSKKWLQLKSNISGKEISTLECNEAGALGAAILAATAAGTYSDINSAVNSMVKVKDTYYPNEKATQVYKEKFEQYMKLYKDMKSTSEFITRKQNNII